MTAFRKLSFVGPLLLASPAYAHSGHGSGSFFAGLAHPVMGLDHLIMLLAFGLLAAYLQKPLLAKVKLVAVALSTLMLGLVGGQWLGGFTGMELAIGLSLFTVSAAIWQAFSANKGVMNALVALSIGLLFFHGYAHGVEAEGSIAPFASGMFISATVLIACGAQVGRVFANPWVSVGIASVSSLVLFS